MQVVTRTLAVDTVDILRGGGSAETERRIAPKSDARSWEMAPIPEKGGHGGIEMLLRKSLDGLTIRERDLCFIGGVMP